MAKISDLSDELLVKILSYLPTKKAVSTSILSKQWEFLWMWSSNLEFDCTRRSVRAFINKNLPLHRAPIINRLRLDFGNKPLPPERFKSWVEIAVSRSLRELICVGIRSVQPILVLPSSLYTCNSLVTLKLESGMIFVDVPEMVCLPSLKTLKLSDVTYSNEDSLRLLLSYCPVLEDLHINRQSNDNVTALVIMVPSLQRLTLFIAESCSEHGDVIVTPSLKYLDICDERFDISYLIEHMPELEEANIIVMPDNDIEKLLKSITSVKRLKLFTVFNTGCVVVYLDGIVFNQLTELKLITSSENWSEIIFQLLKNSPNLETLDIVVKNGSDDDWEYRPSSWSNNQAFVPKCLLKTLKTFKFEGFRLGAQNDFLSFVFKHARRLESSSISLQTCYDSDA